MNNIKEFNENPMSLSDFWMITGPFSVGVLLLTAMVILWKRPIALRYKKNLYRYFCSKRIDNKENQWQENWALEGFNSSPQPES